MGGYPQLQSHYIIYIYSYTILVLNPMVLVTPHFNKPPYE